MKTASRFPDHPPVDIAAGNNREVKAASERSVMRMLRIAGLICMLLSMVHQNVQAQTDWKDNYVTLAAEDQTNPSIARPSNEDYTIVVWQDGRDDDTTGLDIYAQKIDNINGLPQWLPADGVPVCTAAGDQTNPRAAYDSVGHVIIVWEDERGAGNTISVFGQCLNVSDGAVATNWQTNGIAVCDTSADAKQPRIVGVAEGAFIAWVDSRNRLAVTDSSNSDIYLQHLYSRTAGWPTGSGVTWQSCGILVSGDTTGQHDDRKVELARDHYWAQAVDRKDKDGVVLVYESRRDTSETLGDSIYVVFADSYDADGNWRWYSQDVRCADNSEEQLNPRLVVLGNRHGVGDSVAVIVWQDVRENPTDLLYHIYGQVIEKHFGNIVGAGSGNAVCTADYTQRYPELSLVEIEEHAAQLYESRIICVWEDMRNDGSTGIDVYGAVMDGVTMSIITGTGADGEEICRNATDQRYPMVDNFPDDPEAYLVWQHGDPDSHTDVWYQSMNLWTLTSHWTQPVGMAVTEAKDSQVKPQVGGDVFVYADRRRNPITSDSQYDWNIYAETPGECVGSKYMDWRDMFADVTETGGDSHMRFTVDESGNVFVVWQETGLEEGEQNVYMQKFDSTGVPRWKNSGIRLNTSIFASEPEVTESDTEGGAQVVWQQTTQGTDSVYYAKVSPTGALTVIPVCEDCRKPVIDYAEYTFAGGGISTDYDAYIGVIGSLDGGGDKIRMYGFTSDLGGWWEPAFDPNPTGSYVDIIMDATATGDFFTAAWEDPVQAGNIDVVWGTDAGISGDASIGYAALGGCAISADYTGLTGPTGHYGGFILYSMTSPLGSYELYANHIQSDGPIDAQHQLTVTPANDVGYTSPAMCQDNAPNGMGGSGYSGMLVVWDYQYLLSGNQAHKLQTQKFEYLAVSDVIRWSDTLFLDVTDPVNYTMQADIARVPKWAITHDTTSLIVWSGITEICSPSRPKEILSQWMLYDTTAGLAKGRQWSEPKRVGPGPGNYSQHSPIVKNAKSDRVNVFWLDGRAGNDLVLGTRLTADSSDTELQWFKVPNTRDEAVVASMTLGASYPNPLSLQRSTVASIMVELAEPKAISLKLYDNLGRVVAVVYEGDLPGGVHTLRVDASGLSAGMYFYVLRGSDVMATRGLVVVR